MEEENEENNVEDRKEEEEGKRRRRRRSFFLNEINVQMKTRAKVFDSGSSEKIGTRLLSCNTCSEKYTFL